MGGPLSFLYVFYKAFGMFCPKSQAGKTVFLPHFGFLLGVPLGVIFGHIVGHGASRRAFFQHFLVGALLMTLREAKMRQKCRFRGL